MTSFAEIKQKISRLAKIVRLGAKESGVPAVADLARAVIEAGIEREASDIHLEPTESNLRVRYRIGGSLLELFEPLEKNIHSLLLSRLKVIAHMDSGDRLRPADGHIGYVFGDHVVDLRVAAMPSVHGEFMVIRILDPTRLLTKIDELSFTPENEQKFRRIIELQSGLFVAAGPMNSGKSTALYVALREMSMRQQVIMTIEDPVECLIAGVNQINVNPKADLSFEQGLRAMLRMDADTLMVGEVRDEATARLAVRAALTGHLLLTSVHARDSVTTMLRLREMGVSPYFLAATLVGVLAQRLVRRICSLCHGNGCDACNGTGFKGRIAIQEILSPDDKLREDILHDLPLGQLRTNLRQRGFRTMHDDGMEKVNAGLTSVEEVNRVLAI